MGVFGNVRVKSAPCSFGNDVTKNFEDLIVDPDQPASRPKPQRSAALRPYRSGRCLHVANHSHQDTRSQSSAGRAWVHCNEFEESDPQSRHADWTRNPRCDKCGDNPLMIASGTDTAQTRFYVGRSCGVTSLPSCRRAACDNMPPMDETIIGSVCRTVATRRNALAACFGRTATGCAVGMRDA